MKYTEVFVAGGMPKLTYNPRSSRGLESQLEDVADNLCKLVMVTGHTKSGKTVLVRGKFPTGESVWIDGGSIKTDLDLWDQIINRLGLYQDEAVSSSDTKSSEVSAEVSSEQDLFVWSGIAKVGGKKSSSKALSTNRTRRGSSQIIAIAGLQEARLPLIVDDFHYIPREVQGTIVRALKAPIFDGLPVILIAIPHRRFDVLKVEREMTGRLHSIQVPLWEREELSYISRTGFAHLKSALSISVSELLTAQAVGSPHLMQDFCRAVCQKCNILSDKDGRNLNASSINIDQVFRDVALAVGRPIFEKLARGPRQRTDRIPRNLKNGKKVDIYELVLRALAHLRPELSTFEYEHLRSAIRDISHDVPQLHEVSRVLRHMTRIASSDESSTAVIDFDDKEKTVHVTDPFFAFFLRWGDLSMS